MDLPELAWRSVPTSRKRGAGVARMIRVLDVRTGRWKWVRLSSLNVTELRAAAGRPWWRKAYSRPGINRQNPPGGGMVRGDGRIRWLSDVVAKATPRGRFWMFLSSFPNPDYGETRAPAKPVLVWADTLQELRKKAEVYRDEKGLGGGNWGGAIFGSGRTILGHFSYNGRAWEGLPWEGLGPEIVIGGSVGRNGVVGRPDPLPWGALSQIEKTEIRKQWDQFGYDDKWFASLGWIKRYGLWEWRPAASKNRRTR